MAGRRSTARALRDFLALDDDWARPVPAVGRSDVLTGALLVGVGLLTIELSRSAGGLSQTGAAWWVQYLVVAAGAVALVWRRRHPIAVAVYLAGHMFLTGVTMPAVMGQLSLQICYFTGLLSAMAWSRDRRTAALTAGAILTFMLCWVAWQFAVGSALQDYYTGLTGDDPEGFLPALPSAVVLTFLINVLYFCGAIVGGQVAWRGARQRARLAHQAATIEQQARTLQRRAVVGERLRIARELHDVVGHHVSVIGVQAAGARRVLDRDPAAATAALGTIEATSREAVTQMRSLLGTLRGLDGGPTDEGEAGDRTAGPGLADLPALVDSRGTPALRTTYECVEDVPGAGHRVPTSVARSLYRTAQEALANITRHSTATQASVTVRVTEKGPVRYAEMEVLDDGRPRHGTSGSGLGLLGIRERVASHRGECEIGPRATRGYRVRVRMPLPSDAASRGTHDG